MTATPTAPDATSISAGAVSFPAPPRTSGALVLAGRVLLAEDGLDKREIISLHLRKAGAEVVMAENGRVAVDLAGCQPLDLILMDIDMPVLDGYAATRELRAAGCTLPIVALTAHCDDDEREKCLAAGCTDYLAKPIEKSRLLASVAAYLSGGSLADSAPAAAPIAPQGQTLESSFAHEAAMQEPIAQFVALLPYRVAIMERLLREGNLVELRRVVHQIKGAGGGYGFDAITELATQADRALKQETPPQTLASEVDRLIALIRTVEGYQPSREHFHG
ncbi:MAG TPA: response regulator [Pirellulales bacterium]|nr:response regulator [Pirellulales bacterium]